MITIALTPEQSRALAQAGDRPVRFEDPETRKVYLLVDAGSSPEASDLPSIEEQKMLLSRLGRSLGWDDPEMDVYDELDPRRARS